MKDIMQQATNKITIIGKLLDATFNKGTTSEGKPYERANLTVRVIYFFRYSFPFSVFSIIVFNFSVQD